MATNTPLTLDDDEDFFLGSGTISGAGAGAVGGAASGASAARRTGSAVQFSSVGWDTDTRREGSGYGDVKDPLAGSPPPASPLTTRLPSTPSSPSHPTLFTPNTPPFISSPSHNSGVSSSSGISSSSNSQPRQSLTSLVLAASNALTVSVQDPQKHGEGTEAHTSYLVVAKSPHDILTHPTVSARRRFNEFTWLHRELAEEFPAAILPPLPGRRRLESYVTGSRFDPEFVEDRRRALQTYLERVARHPSLQRSKALKIFLEGNEPLARAQPSPQPTHATLPGTSSAPSSSPPAVLDTLSDTLMNAFSKLRSRDERFAEASESMARLEEAVAGVGRGGGRMVKAEKDLDHDLAEFSLCVLELSKMETAATATLARFAQAVRGTAERLREKIAADEAQYLNGVHEYLAYCQSAKETLKLRDQKQLDHQDLSDFLQQTISERDKLVARGFGSSGVGGVAGYIKGQFDAVRGVNPETARQERIAKLEKRVVELQENSETSLAISRAFSATLARELDLFSSLKVADYRKYLGDHARAQANYFREVQRMWEEVVPELEAYEVPE
ncbi:hypothetical protein M427DRAFT_54148 [Gonapodya prolifera JEL478]|uniref:Sorting nexin-4 n=1 Tax=Gonapodya prolifera (strain JEL478) TaxID=1344416 RepID=A0A139AMZ8_GONPJ|nr:hypothetical protein M427DRAFT_54148 [Gonapodya prolifera JEL478]|eukprot:KXS17903.1 hypothetical protein M427DRAFT_54148 [Gonapodya prolifera JEL478]